MTLSFIINIEGSFAGGAELTALSEASVDLFARGAGVPVIDTRGFTNKFVPTRLVKIDVAAQVGESFEMLMKLHVSAGALNDGHSGNVMSVADVRNTSHLYVDVSSGDAEFIGSDGYRYATPTLAGPVPEPSALAIMVTGLACIGMLVRRRRS